MTEMTLEHAETVLQKHWGHTGFRKAQARVVEAALAGRDVLAVLPTGYGKCHAEGDEVLLATGQVKAVEDVDEFDTLMGPDGKPRTILELLRGEAPMVRILPKKGDPFTVTLDHVLTLAVTGEGEKSWIDVPVREYLGWSKNKKHLHKLTHVPIDSFGVSPDNLPMLPYHLGLFLGDGSLGQAWRAGITTLDREIKVEVEKIADLYSLDIREDNLTYYFTKGVNDPTVTNQLQAALRSLGLCPVACDRKFIPSSYLYLDRQHRLELLAGLIDTDGSLNGPASYEFCSKSYHLITDVAFLARSLGFAARIVPCSAGEQYKRVSISGDCSVIPVRIARKRAEPRQQVKDVLKCGFEVIPLDGVHPYYGFTLDGDQRYLMADFTVTHNSATFQVPAIMTGGTAIVVSPLIALMKDQCDDCASRDISASYVNSHVSESEQLDRLQRLVDGEFHIFYIAPERLMNANFRKAIAQADVNYIVIDEAHCASRWGHDFRPAYMRIKELVKLVTNEGQRPPIIAVTATATADIEDDIAEAVGMGTDYVRVVGDPIRPNLRYQVLRSYAEYEEWRHLDRVIRALQPDTGRYVIYCGTRTGSEKVAAKIEETFAQGTVGIYHAGLSKDERETVQDAFKSGRTPIICATCAFGMGIDVPNIRAVIHFGIPGSIEDYCQEAGRAGRDGQPSDVLLIQSEYSVGLRRMFLDMANPPYDAYVDVWNYLHDFDEGEIVQRTALDIARETGQKDGTVNGVLCSMDAYGLIRRQYLKSGTELTIYRNALDTMLPNLSKSMQRVAEYLLDITVDNAGSEALSYEIDLVGCGEDLSINTASFKKLLKKLEESGVIRMGAAYRGKTTRVLKYGEDLSDILPYEKIKKKRDRELARLQAMIEYTHVEDRVKYIRDYFLKGLQHD